MKTLRLSTLGAVATIIAMAMATADAGKICGKVTFKGKPRPARTIKMAADPVCGGLHTTPAKDEKMVVGEGVEGIHPLANVFVYVKSGVDKKNFPIPDSPVVIDQRGCKYEPHVLGIMSGQKLEIVNSDKTTHNVHSRSKKNFNFNNGQTSGAPALLKTFKEEEVMVKIKCDMHPWMTCYVGVLDHPYFTVTGKDGTFLIEGLEDGDYEIEVWQELLKTKVAKVTVSNGSGAADFEYQKPKKK